MDALGTRNLFNVINEIAVNLFKQNKIKFSDITKYVNKYLSLDLKMSVSNVKNVINLHNVIKRKIDIKDEN